MAKSERPLLPQSYTIEQIDTMAKTWTLGAFAAAADARVRQFERQQKLTYIEIGYICFVVDEKKAWRELNGFHSFEDWLTDAAPSSRATCFAAKSEVKRALEDGIDLQVMNRIPRCNLKTMRELSTSLRLDPEIQREAEVKSEQEFKRHIEAKFPDQHIEADAPMRLKPSRSQRLKIEEGIEKCMELYSLPSREAALEVIVVEWLQKVEQEVQV